MVVQKTLDNLKDRPKDERKVVAISAAGAVVLILLAAWVFFWLKSIQREQAASQFDQSDIPADAGAPVQQTGTTYDNSQTQDQFGRPTDAGQ